MFKASLVSTDSELLQILQLQKQNLKHLISDNEMKEQGFLTLEHDIFMLRQMQELAPSVIVCDNGKVVAYALSELIECREVVPALEPMFALFDSLQFDGKPLNEYRYYVMGQICIDKSYRGKGLFELLYHHHREIYQDRFDLFVTEVSTSNHRSLRAHEKLGFQIIHKHHDMLDEWAVVAWDWK